MSNDFAESQPFSSPYRKQLQLAIVASQAAGAILRDYFSRGEAKLSDAFAEQRIVDLLLPEFPTYGYRGEELGLLRQPSDSAQYCWVVDPQDGTSAANQGFRGAAVSIALLRQGQPVLGVVYAYSAPDDSGDLFCWAEGMKSIHRNNQAVVRKWSDEATVYSTALVSQAADKSANDNAKILSPLRYRTVTRIAYRLALVAAGEGDLAVSLNSPTGWDIAGGHALLLAAGGDLFNQHGQAVRYDNTGQPKTSISHCFGGTEGLVKQYVGRDWASVFNAGSSQTAASTLCLLKPGEMARDASVLNRAQGCFLGQLAGDSLGSLVEFKSDRQIKSKYADGPNELQDGGTWGTIAGQPTDDSELALALARSIVAAGGYAVEKAATAYAEWLDSEPFDVGATTSTALRPAVTALKANKRVSDAAIAAGNQDSQANGALMRISPLGVLGAALESEVIIDLARQDARLTHPHVVCQDANAVFAATLAYAIRSGSGAEATYLYALQVAEASKVAEPVLQRLKLAQASPPADFMQNMGWVLVAFQNAFYQLLHASSFENGVVATVRMGGDTDTNGAIAGALLGAVHGRANIPKQWANCILACRPIKGLKNVSKPRTAAYWPVDALALAERLLLCGQLAVKQCTAEGHCLS